MESLARFVAFLLLLITLSAPFGFVLTSKRLQDFTVTRKAMHLARQIIAGVIVIAGISFAAITGWGLRGTGIRLFFAAIIALNIYSVIREVKYSQNRRNL